MTAWAWPPHLAEPFANTVGSGIPGPLGQAWDPARHMDAVRSGHRCLYRARSHPGVRSVVRLGVVATEPVPILGVVGQPVVLGRGLDLVLGPVDVDLLLGGVNPLNHTGRQQHRTTTLGPGHPDDAASGQPCCRRPVAIFSRKSSVEDPSNSLRVC